MVRIGVIAMRPKKNKKSFLKRYKKEIINHEKNPFELIVIIIPYSEEQFEDMADCRRQKVISKAKRQLLNDMVDDVIFTKGLYKYAAGDKNLLSMRNKLFLSIIPLCIKTMVPKCGMTFPLNEICIIDSKLERINEYFLEEICYDAKALKLCTQNTETATSLCERFYDETGLPVQIVKDLKKSYVDILIDTENARIKFGKDLIIDGAELDLYTAGYEVDFLEIAACVKNVDLSRKILSYFSGKKKLTL